MNYLAHGWRSDARVAWLAALVLANALLYWVLPIVARFAFDPISLWLSHLGLASCWMAWGDAPIWKRGPAAVGALLLCSFGAWSWMQWENERWVVFIQNQFPTLALCCLVLQPTRILIPVARTTSGAGRTVSAKHLGQFTVRGLLLYIAAMCTFLGASYWLHGNDISEMLAYHMIWAAQTLAGVVPVALLILLPKKRWLSLGVWAAVLLGGYAINARNITQVSQLLEWPSLYLTAMLLGCGLFAALNVGAFRFLCAIPPDLPQAPAEGNVA